MDKLSEARKKINEIDAAIAPLFEARMRAVEDVIAYKLEHDLPVFDAAREDVVLARNSALIENEAYLPYYTDFLRDMMRISKQYQRSLVSAKTVAYQGTKGAYAYIAMKKLFPHMESSAYNTWEELFCAVEEGDASCGVVPFENSYTGEVGEVLDLLYRHNLYIREIYDLPIRHVLLGVPGAKLEDIKQVYSHPQALSQCRTFLDPFHFEQIPYLNTALASEFVAVTGDITKAAIASEETAELYGLVPLQKNINTSNENTTRFIVVSRDPGKVGTRFSLLFTVRHDAGALAAVMEVIAKAGFNMECIRSKSMRDLPWQYYFYVEIVGDLSSDAAKALLEEVQPLCAELKVLGAYTK